MIRFTRRHSRVLGAALLLLVTRSIEAQTPTGSVSGAVVGVVQSVAGAPVPAAAITLHRALDTALVARASSDSVGAFELRGLALGVYRLDVRRLGFALASRVVKLVASDRPTDVGVIRMVRNVVALEEVAVTADRSAVTVLADRNVYSTRDMPVAAGGTATDVLRSLPELQVSIEGRVTSRGATPRIQINGRPAPMEGEALDRYLQQLPAERIERVEVIANPGARYEAQGEGGIVNIVLRRGIVVGLSGTGAVNVGTRNQRGGSGSLNYESDKLSVFGSGSASFFGNRFRNSDLRQNLGVDPPSFIQQESSSRNRGWMGNLSLGAELQRGAGGAFWADASVGRNPTRTEALIAYTYLDALSNPTRRFDRLNDTDLRSGFGSFAVGYRETSDEGKREWSLELRRNVNTIGNDDESTRQWFDVNDVALDVPLEMTFAGQRQTQHGLSWQANLRQPWGKAGQLEAGYEESLRESGDESRVRADSSAVAPAEGSVSDFRQREHVYAAFVSLNRSVGRVNVQLGLRGEDVATRRALPLTDESFEASNRYLVPSALVSTELDHVGEVSVSYARRVDRPWGSILNPAVPTLDSLNRRIGNPFLLPRYTHSFALTLTRTGRLGLIQLSPYFRRTVNGWDQVRSVDPNGVSTLTWQNVAKVSTYGGSISASLTPTGRVTGTASISAYREVRDASNLASSYSGASTQLSLVSLASVRATPTSSVQGWLTYLPARNLPQGRISPLVFSSVGARRMLWGGRGAVSIAIVDPFELQHFKFTTRDSTFSQVGSSKLSARRVTLEASYNFGRPSRQRARRRGGEESQDTDVRVIR